MSMTSTAGTLAVPADPDRDTPVSFARLIHVELRKLLDTRTNRWVLAVITASTPVVIAVMLIVAHPADLTFDKLLDYTQTPQKILLPALGILAMTSEWSQRTGLVTFTLIPSRRRVLTAKFVAVIALGLIVIATAFAVAALGNLLAGTLAHGNGSWSFSAPDAGQIVLVQLTGLVQGMAFGMALLSSAAAIAAYYVVPNLSTVLFRSSSALHSAAPWLDLNQAQAPLYTHDITGAGWIHLLVAATIWILAPLFIGITRVSRAEVTSG